MTISPHLTTTTTPNHFITTFLQHCSPRLSQEQWTQTIYYLHIPHCENKNHGKSIFLFSIYLQSTMNLNLPTPSTCQMMMDLNNHQCRLAPNFTSHIARARSAQKQNQPFSLLIYVATPQMCITRMRILPVSPILFTLIILYHCHTLISPQS